MAIVASLLSLSLLVVFWSWSLVFGVLIDLALIAAAVIRPEWTDWIGPFLDDVNHESPADNT